LIQKVFAQEHHGCLFLQRQVHAFMTPVLFGMARLGNTIEDRVATKAQPGL
jgi:hypothetical protein